MTQNKIEFGFCVPIFANPGMTHFRTPNYREVQWRDVRESALLAESLGFDSVFVADHLLLGHEGAIWECWTTLSVIAGMTSKIKLAPIHLCDSFRNPALTAKMISTLDHASAGRFINFYDYGWRRKEFDQCGFEFEKDSNRIRKMDEGITIIKGLLEHGTFSFQGKYHQANDTTCVPKPFRKVPLWMGEADHPAMVASIVRHADVFNSMPASPDGLERKLAIIEEECKKQSRSFDSLGTSLETQILILDSSDDFEARINELKALKVHNQSGDKDILEQLAKTDPSGSAGEDVWEMRDKFLIGTADEIVEKICLYEELGVEHFMLWFMDFPNPGGMRAFAKEVMPKVKKLVRKK